MDIPNSELREFILSSFSDDELEDFCFDYFPQAQYEFGSGMSVGTKARLLISFAERRGLREHLVVDLGKARPQQFAARFQSVPQPPPAPLSATTRLTRRIFISHAGEDAALARRLSEALQAAGRSIWIAPDSILPGEQWVEAIGRGLSTSGIFVVLITPNAVTSRWVQYEMNLAIHLERQGRMEIIPLDMAQAEPPLTWMAYQFVPFRNYAADLPYVLKRLASRRRPNFTDAGHPLPPPPEPPQRGKESVASPPEPAPVEPPPRRREEQVARAPSPAPAGSRLPRHPDRLPGPPPPVIMPDETPTASSLYPTFRLHAATDVTLVRVPSGRFLFGPERRPLALDTFWIGRYPVTNAQYRRFLRENPHHAVPHVAADWARPFNWDPATRDYPPGRADHPVVLVGWTDAQAYCEWGGLRLPTEEEWEKAARGEDGRPYPWGDEPLAPDRCNFNRAHGGTTPAGAFSPRGDSPFHCGDMVGNVCEWTDTPGSTPGTRIMRGGAWSFGAEHNTNVFRMEAFTERQAVYMGFRVATANPTAPRPVEERRVQALTGVEFIHVPAGPFFFGDERQPLSLPGFWIARTEITNAQFERFVRATGHRTVAEEKGYGRVWRDGQWVRGPGAHWRRPDGVGSSIDDKADHPVVQVSAVDAWAYCRWAGLRLPMEQEWEKAARGSDSRVFPWGNADPSPEYLNYGRVVNDTTPVGAYSPRGDSAYGLADMAGNVWEWTSTPYDRGKDLLVLKGGSWADPETSWLRGAAAPRHTQASIGFRVAATVLPTPSSGSQHD